MSDKQKTTTEPDSFVVCNDAVGRFWKGQEVTAADLGAPADRLNEAQMQRLVDLGAIAPAGSRKAQDMLTELGENHVTPVGDRIDDEAAVARQVAEAPASIGRSAG
jgi:hypothetical protein